MRTFLVALTMTAICNLGHAEIDRKIAVYRSVTSVFSSGEVQQSVLQKGLSRTTLVPWWQVQTAAGQVGFVPAERVFTAQQMASVPVTEGLSYLQLSTALTKGLSELHQSPARDSKIKLQVPEGQVIQVLNFAIAKDPDENWIRARYKNQEGFMDLRDLSTAMDLISSVALKNGDLERVHYTLGGWMFTQQGRKIGAGEVASVDWKPQAFLAQDTQLKESTKPSGQLITTLPAGSRVQLLRPVQQEWGHSFVPRLGLMAWANQVVSLAPTPAQVLSTEELFQQGLFDMATHPSRPLLRVASAKGIFLTENGTDWRRIKGFDHQNQAVTFTGGGHLVVGDRISADLGKTFEPLIRWDTVTPMIKSATQRVPSWMRITSINSRGEDLRVDVEIGRGASVRLVSSDLGQNWKLDR